MRRRRARIALAVWALAAATGVFAWTHLPDRLSGSIEVPGSSSQVASEALEEHFGEAGGGSFVVLFQAPGRRWASPRFLAAVESSLARGARAVGGRASALHGLSPQVSYAGIATTLTPREARERVAAVTTAVGNPAGARARVTGFPVLAGEISSVIATDLRRAELVALPVTAAILLLFFGSVPAAAIPLLFGLATISVAMGVLWLETLVVSIPIYATNVVTLVGIALAVDYSMLYVARYREEMRDGDAAAALATTARTSGRALAISGAVVAAGLAPLAFIPIPFFSGLGLATVVIPVVSVLAAMTLLPGLLWMLGPRLQRQPLRRRRRRPGKPLGERLVALVMRRAGTIAVLAGALMLAIALPASALQLTGGSAEFSRRAELDRLPGGVAAAAPLAPYEVVIDGGRAGGARTAPVLGAERRLLRLLLGDRAVRAVQAQVEAGSAAQAVRLGLLDPTARFSRMRVSGAFPSGSSGAEGLVRRLRSRYVPRAGFRPGQVAVGGPAASDYDFVQKVKNGVPLLVLVIVVVMYVLLTVLLRSPLLPLKAIAMSALSVAAACGVLVAVFQLGWAGPLSPPQPERIEAWVPVLLFAALFGISTDYEIFMVTRMREEWLRDGDNERAVRTGLRLIGAMITASALVMLVIFAGFTASRVTSLQQFGVGLVSGVFFDATVVRLMLVPALMKMMGRWNWTFPLAGRPPADAGAARTPGGR